MTAGRYDRIVIEQGATFDLPIRLPYDLTGAIARASAGLSYGDALVDFEVEILSSAATGSRINVHADADAITAYTFDDAAKAQGFLPGVWNLEIILSPTASNNVIRVLEGRCKFVPDVDA